MRALEVKYRVIVNVVNIPSMDVGYRGLRWCIALRHSHVLREIGNNTDSVRRRYAEVYFVILTYTTFGLPILVCAKTLLL